MATWTDTPPARPSAGTYPPRAWPRFIRFLLPAQVPEKRAEHDGPCVGDHGAEAAAMGGPVDDYQEQRAIIEAEAEGIDRENPGIPRADGLEPDPEPHQRNHRADLGGRFHPSARLPEREAGQ